MEEYGDVRGFVRARARNAMERERGEETGWKSRRKEARDRWSEGRASLAALLSGG